MGSTEESVLLKDIAETAAEKAVSDMLTRLGVDHSNPLEVQKDFIALREIRDLLTDKQFQADLSHLRKWRQAMESGTTKGLLTLITLLVTGAVGLLAVGIKDWFGR